MSQKVRPLLAGAVIGGLAAGLLALPNLLPAAMADEQPWRTLMGSADELMPRQIDVAGLVKPDFTLENSVSAEILHSTTVRKIGYGRTTFVTIAETASGTYSSDGLASPHVQYPGIHVNHSSVGPRVAQLGIWTGSGWTAIEPAEGSSFVTVSRFDGGRLVTTEAGSCVVVRDGTYC
jgi:hypothetical protein